MLRLEHLNRSKILYEKDVFTNRSFSEPEVVKKELLDGVRAVLGEDYDIDSHFTPRYRPWRQRIAFIPDADLFQSVREGKASVVTDEVASTILAPTPARAAITALSETES